jgi:hypothetical protein
MVEVLGMNRKSLKAARAILKGREREADELDEIRHGADPTRRRGHYNYFPPDEGEGGYGRGSNPQIHLCPYPGDELLELSDHQCPVKLNHGPWRW